MRIGIDVLHRASGGGLTFLEQLLEDWRRDGTFERNELVIFASRESAAALRQSVPCLDRWADVVTFRAAGRSLLGRLWSQQIRLVHEIARRRVQVVLCANVMPLLSSAPVVTVFQNLAPFCVTVTPATMGFRSWARLALLGRLMRFTAARSARVVFGSCHFRDLFTRRFGLPTDVTEVIPPAGGAGIAAEGDPILERRLGIQRPFILSVSHLNPYKNTVELVEAFARATAEDPQWQLVLVGMANFPRYLARVMAAIHAHGVESRVVLTGGLPRSESMALMASCAVFVFSSTCENCPTALVEAISLGVPVASSNLGPMPEVVGEAALLFDPQDPEAIAETLRVLICDPTLRSDLAARAVHRAHEFSTRELIAQRTLAAVLAAGGAV